MNPLLWADDKLITRVAEPIAWRAQCRWGCDNFQLAHAVNDITGLAGAAAQITIAVTEKDYGFIPFYLFVSWRIWSDGRAIIHSSADMVKKNPTALNPARVGFRRTCRIILAWFILPIFGLLLEWAGAYGLGATFAFGYGMMTYLSACNPLPPGWQPPQKVRLPAAALPQAG